MLGPCCGPHFEDTTNTIRLSLLRITLNVKYDQSMCTIRLQENHAPGNLDLVLLDAGAAKPGHTTGTWIHRTLE